jgi:predicted TIM-barrel fold metal-dependent hydrolase
MGSRITRRSCLRFGLLAGVSACCDDPVPAPPPFSRSVPDPAIDVHCHFFNGADLPVEGFIEKVFLKDHFDRLLLRDIKGYLIPRLSAFLVEHSVGYEAEVAYLRGALPRVDPVSACNASIMRLLRDSLAGSPPGAGAPLELRRHPEHPAFARRLLAALRPEAISYLQTMDPGASPLLTPRDILRYDNAFAQTISHYFSWAAQMVDYRVRNVDRYFRMFGPERQGIGIVTPSMVDYHRWLGPDRGLTVDAALAPAEPIERQVDLMELIARQRMNVLPFVPLDPRRPWPETEALLQRCFSASNPTGFAGAKLYPPLGYRPLGNSHLLTLFGDGPEVRELALTVDANLAAIYEFCATHDVPLMAHSSASNRTALAEHGDSTNAAYWATVLERYPRLRLNLSHFGGVGAFAADPGNAGHVNIGGLFTCDGGGAGREGCNLVFADIANEVSASEAPFRRRFRAAYARYFQDHPDLPNRLMYGSDWDILGIEQKFETFLNDWNRLVHELAIDLDLPDLPARFFFENARRFLGLSGPDNENAQRLRAFYRQNFEVPSWLAAA